MALATRLKKSLNGGKSSSKKKNDKFDSRGNGSDRKHGEREDRKSLFSEKKFDRRGRDSDDRTFGRRPLDRNRRDFSWDDPKASMRNSRETRGMRDNERRPLFTEKKIGRNGRDSDDMTFGRRSVDGNRRGLPRDDPEASMRNPRETREMRGNERRHLSTEKKIGGNGRDSDDRIFGRRPINKNRRDFSRDGNDEETKSPSRPHEMRGRHGERIPLRSEVIDQLKARGRNVGRKRRDANGVDSEARTSNTTAREMRGDVRSERDFGRCGKIDDKKEETDESVDSVEASSAKLRLKWKKMDKKQNVVNDRDQSKGEVLERRTKNEDKDEQIAEEKSVRHQKRVLDKSGKKLRVGKISSDDGSAEKSAPVKKKKRVIKLDPYDISNKRLDDSAPIDDKNEEKDSDISKNAQFRAIQPSPSILSFVEDNLLGRRRLKELKDAGYNVKLSAPLDNIPFSTSTERERIEDNVFKNKLEFFAAAKISSSFPPPLIPEIAFAGRSNVGKSSLLNALTRQWGVVRTSDKPGLTQTINFFSLAPKLCLVDLPGYGFAYAKEEVKDAWEELVKEYVSTRVGLQRVCLLIDTKWGMKPRDHELIDLMERSKTPYHIVLTKTDLVFPIDVARRAMQIQENLKKNKSIINPVAMVSSKSGAGVRNLRSVLAKITRFVKP